MSQLPIQNESEEARSCTPLQSILLNNHSKTSSVEVQTEIDKFELGKLYSQLSELEIEIVEKNALNAIIRQCFVSTL